MGNAVNHPAHYGGDVKYEAIKLIDDWLLGFSGGNALKYILRAPHKGNEWEDLLKAQWYLNHAVKINEARRWTWNLFVLFRVWFGVYGLLPCHAARFHNLNGNMTRAVHAIARRDWVAARKFVDAEFWRDGAPGLSNE